MESEVRTLLLARLAERGLKPESYDDQVLTLHYDPAHDSEALAGQAVDLSALSQYANEVLHSLPGADTLFPRMQEVHVETSAID